MWDTVSRTCACTCELYVWGMWCGETKHTPTHRRLVEVHLRFHFAQFLLNVCFIFSCQNLAVSHENTTTGSMSDPETFKAEIVFIKDSVEGGAGNMIQAETKLEVSTTAVALSMSCGDCDRKICSENIT